MTQKAKESANESAKRARFLAVQIGKLEQRVQGGSRPGVSPLGPNNGKSGLLGTQHMRSEADGLKFAAEHTALIEQIEALKGDNAGPAAGSECGWCRQPRAGAPGSFT